ncbi:MAG: ADP-ribosylation factor-like protein [Candidatus Thorarchaeota archaeon]
MIHNTYLVRISNLEILAHTQYWPVEVVKKDIEEFITTREELRTEDVSLANFPLIVGDDKFHGRDLSQDVVVVFVTDKGEDESAIADRLDAAIKGLRSKLVKSDILNIAQQYEQIIEPSVITRLKIALVGEGGVGKTTTLHLLMGDTPPLQYVPTIALNLETVENIRFGNYSLVLWDFAGQERFRNLWKFYFHGADVIFLVCDSSLRNVIISKDILKLIKRDAPKVPVFSLANKQDKPNAMRPEVVQKILGIPTYPMVAIDKSRRDEMLRILMTAAAQFVGVVLPDLPASELLRFTDEATAALSEQHLDKDFEEIVEDEEEYEEVFVDEEGHIISAEEMGDDYEYEIVEEIVEVEEESTDMPSLVEEEPDVAETSVIEEVGSDDTTIESIDEFEEEIPLEAEDSEEGEVPLEIEDVDELPIMDATLEEEDLPTSSEIVEVRPPEGTSLADPDDMTVFIDEFFPSPVETEADDSHRMAKDLISEALDADDIISAEIDRVSKDELDVALEAFSSEEVISSEGELDEDAKIADETLKELENILGSPDEPVSIPKDPASEEYDDEFDALDELFALMSDKEEDSSEPE